MMCYSKHIEVLHSLLVRGSTFRESYKRVRVLRSVLSEASWLLLSATFTQTLLDDTTKHLGVAECVTVVAQVPDRPNIWLAYHGESGMKKEEVVELQDYIEELKVKGKDAQKCIIYCK